MDLKRAGKKIVYSRDISSSDNDDEEDISISKKLEDKKNKPSSKQRTIHRYKMKNGQP